MIGQIKRRRRKYEPPIPVIERTTFTRQTIVVGGNPALAQTVAPVRIHMRVLRHNERAVYIERLRHALRQVDHKDLGPQSMPTFLQRTKQLAAVHRFIRTLHAAYAHARPAYLAAEISKAERARHHTLVEGITNA